MLIFNVICALVFYVIYMLAVSEHIKHYANVSISNFALYCVILFLDHYYSQTIVLNCKQSFRSLSNVTIYCLLISHLIVWHCIISCHITYFIIQLCIVSDCIMLHHTVMLCPMGSLCLVLFHIVWNLNKRGLLVPNSIRPYHVMYLGCSLIKLASCR